MGTDLLTTATVCTQASDEGRMAFPEVIGLLIQAGIERYHADFIQAHKTYYQADGTSVTVPSRAQGPVALEFSATGVAAAVQATASGAIGYAAFCDRLTQAGCAGYLVSLPGRRVVYYGRTAETHVEHFPPAL